MLTLVFKNLCTYCSQPQRILIVPSTRATHFGSTDSLRTLNIIYLNACKLSVLPKHAACIAGIINLNVIRGYSGSGMWGHGLDLSGSG